jgi:hypothetical protein
LFRLEALKDCRLLPCYTFLLQTVEGGCTSLQLTWEEKGLIDPVDKFFSFRSDNISDSYSRYLQLLRQLIQEKPAAKPAPVQQLKKTGTRTCQRALFLSLFFKKALPYIFQLSLASSISSGECPNSFIAFINSSQVHLLLFFSKIFFG